MDDGTDAITAALQSVLDAVFSPATMSGDAMATTNSDGCTAACFLVAEDPDKPATWHLQVKDADGTPNHTLMGAAWAALHDGYRGNKYAGPNAAEALAALKALYKAEHLPTPDEQKTDDMDDAEFKLDAPFADTEFKALAFAVDSTDLAPNEFKGHVAATGNVDEVGDYIPSGAFASVIPQFKATGKVYVEHAGALRGDLPIGRPTEAYEDGKGLFIRGRVSETTQGKDALVLLRDGVIDRLSIGYKPKRVRYMTHAEGKATFGDAAYRSILDRLPLNRPRIRVIEEFKSLFDASFVAIPANPQAKLLGVKSGLHAGQTLEDQFSEVHAANEDLLTRLDDLATMRFKAGRMLSSANVQKLQSMRDDHAALLQKLDDLIDAALPKDTESDGKAAEMADAEVQAAIRAEHIRFLAQQARALGVPLT